MTDSKTKVKDLAVELGVSTKDLLRVLRDLDIIAKSTMSAITAEDLSRVKAHLQGAGQDKSDDRREIEPGVIVRRRRHVVAETTCLASENDADKTQKPSESAGDAQAPAGDAQAPAGDTQASAGDLPKPAGDAHAPAGDLAKPARAVVPAAKIIAPTARIVEPVKVITEELPDVSQAMLSSHADTAVATTVPTATSASATVVTPTASSPETTAPLSASDVVGANQEVSAPTTPISTPAQMESTPLVQATTTDALSPDKAQAAPDSSDSSLEADAKPKIDKKREPKPRKPKGLREAAPVARVISRPQDILAAKEAAAAAEAVKAAEAALLSGAAAEAQKAEIEAKQARKLAPQASAKPEGSSAVSLLPPINEGPLDEEEKERRRKRRPEPAAPQVRIISRPDLQAQQQERIDKAAAERANAGGGAPGASDRNAPRGDNRYPRDSRAAPGARPAGVGQDRRPYTPGSRPPAGGAGGAGGFDARDKDSRPAARPVARPAGGAPKPGGFPPAGPLGGLEREGQSKKKRNKNKRPGEFQQPDATVGKRRDDDDDMPRFRSAKRRPKMRQPVQSTQPLKAAKRKIRIEEAIKVSDMAHQMGLKANELIKVLFNLGIMATINNALDIDTATLVAAEFDYEVEKVGFAEEDYITSVDETTDSPELMKLRPPVVTIMGHVDHGKTSLLDAIRKTNVTGGEAGGITQHIGAYHVSTKRGEIVFLDTPGHEAFTAMRARGAQVTDLVVLVVAADDGVMEQTREAVNHAKAAKVPIMVAVNKMDKPEANPDRVLRELSEIGLVAEDWGGDTVISKVSAKTREGLDDLLELLALQADILELKANPQKPARGHIVEAKLDKGRGPVATVLIQEGTLHQGDTFVCGVFSGKVRAMFNDQGRKVKDAGPSMPVEVQGFDGVPEAGEEFICLADEKLARRIADSRAIKQRERELAKESRVTLETFLSRSPDSKEALTLNLVVKSDVQGSLEAILEALRKLSTEKVRINIIHGGTGAITESDIILASASDAIVIGFNVRPTAKVKEVAEHENVDIRFYDIIYKLVDEIKSAMAGLLAPVSREVYLGQAEVREVFSVPKVGAIAGSHVSDGKLVRNAGVRILRDGIVVHTGKISSLRRFKDDVKEVLKGYECGISLENFNDIKVGDVLETFETAFEAATL